METPEDDQKSSERAGDNLEPTPPPAPVDFAHQKPSAIGEPENAAGIAVDRVVKNFGSIALYGVTP